MNMQSTFTMVPAGPFEAGSFTTIHFTVTIGGQGMKADGSIKITTPNMGWGKPFVTCARSWIEEYEDIEIEHNPWKPLNTTLKLETKGDARARLDVQEAVIEKKHAELLLNDSDIYNYFHNWRWWLTVKIDKADLLSGDKVRITYGDTKEHPHGIKVQPWDEKRMDFLAIIDSNGDGKYDLLEGAPFYVDVVPGPPEKLKVAIPSLTTVDDPFPVRYSVLDRNLCPPADAWQGEVTAGDHGLNGVWIRTFDAIQRVKCTKLTPSGISEGIAKEKGRHHVYLVGPEKSRSNPTLTVDGEEKKIFWGDLHAQSKYHQWYPFLGYGDSHRSPKELYAYARDCSMLDFVAITDAFSPYAENAGWEEIQHAAVDCYEPDRFVSLKGWECGMNIQGDKCVIYRSAEVEGHIPKMLASEKHPTASHALSAFYREHPERVLTIPHSFMKYLDWSVLDPELDRVIEIYSSWGSYESREDNPLNTKRCPLNQSAQYVWGQGALLGVTAAGDSHLGYPGRSLPYSDRYWCQNFKAGLCAVYADSLTRENVWDSLYDRYSYGTTGARIVVKFHLNDTHMGQVLEYENGDNRLNERDINVTVVGTDLIRRVDIIKNNSVLYRHKPDADYVEFKFQDLLTEQPNCRDFYYVRVFQADNNAAWSSPIWVGEKGCSTPANVTSQ